MAFLAHPSLSKIPGGYMPLAKKEKHIKDLSKLTRIQLLEIKEREETLLRNKSKLNRLPDKGRRIKDFYEKVILELERQCNVDEAAAMFSKLNVNSNGGDAINQFEWIECSRDSNADPLAYVPDPDTENEIDPLWAIAQRTEYKKYSKFLPSKSQLITADDLTEVKPFSREPSESGLFRKTAEENVSKLTIEADVGTDGDAKLKIFMPKLQQIKKNISSNNTSIGVEAQLDRHSSYLMGVADLTERSGHTKFYAHKTTKIKAYESEKKNAQQQSKYWEITAATPSPMRNIGAQVVTLQDSIKIQTDYLAKLKTLHEEHATERLAVKIERLKNHNIKTPKSEECKYNTSFCHYRSPVNQIEGMLQSCAADEVFDLELR